MLVIFAVNEYPLKSSQKIMDKGDHYERQVNDVGQTLLFTTSYFLVIFNQSTEFVALYPLHSTSYIVTGRELVHCQSFPFLKIYM